MTDSTAAHKHELTMIRVTLLLMFLSSTIGCLYTERLADGGLDGCEFSCQQAGLTCGSAVACGVEVSCGPPCMDDAGTGSGGGGGGTGGGGTGGGGTGGGGTGGGGMGGGGMGGGGTGGDTGRCAGLTGPTLISRVALGTLTSEYQANDFLPVDGTLYVARAGSIGGTGWNPDGQVSQVPLTGGSEVPYTSMETWPINLQKVGTDLYFIDRSWAKLKRVTSSGSVEEVFTAPPRSGPKLASLDVFRIRDGMLFWADLGASNATAAVFRRDLTTGEMVALAVNIPNIQELIVDDTGVYWISVSGNTTAGWTTTVYGLPHGTFSPQVLTQSAPSTAHQVLGGLASDVGHLYFYDRTSSPKTLVMDKNTRTIRTMISGTDARVVPSDGWLYWLQPQCLQYSGSSCISWQMHVKKMSASSTNPTDTTTLDTIPGWFYTPVVRVDDSCIYWSDSRDRGVYKFPKG